MVNSHQIVKNLIGEPRYLELKNKIPPPYRPETVYPIDVHIQNIDSKELLEGYINQISNRSNIRSFMFGEYISISSLLETLLTQVLLVKFPAETDIGKMNLHYKLILFCDLDKNAEDNIANIFKFKHIRNIIAHRHQDSVSLSNKEIYSSMGEGIFACFLAKDILNPS